MFIDMFKGRVYAPNDYVILEDTLDAGVRYAGIVAEKYNSIPHIIFFSYKPINELNEKDEEKIYKMCAKINPDITQIHNNEVKAIINNGKIINGKEYDMSKRLGIFAIPEIKDKEKLYLDRVGIIREEKYNG